MLLSSQTDFNYDEQTSSNPPPAGDSGSGRGDRYRNILTGALSFIGVGSSDSRGFGRNDSERWNDNERRNDNQRQSGNSRLPATRQRNERLNTPSYHLSRDDLRDIAINTLHVLDDGEYFPPGAVEPYDLNMKIEWTNENTRYYGPDAGEGGEILEREFIKINEEGGVEAGGEKYEDDKKDAVEQDKNACSLDETQGEKKTDDNPSSITQNQPTVPPDSQNLATPDTPIFIGEYSTLFAARKVHFGLASDLDSFDSKKIGVLNFASAKKPGGGFINGSQAQEESIARTSTLYPSLITDTASQFYAHYQQDPSNAYYTHAMVYSPGIVLFRDDNGSWRRPVEVDVLTSAAVNAGEIRRGIEREERLRREREEMEYWMRKGEERRKENEKIMKEREEALAERKRLREEKAKIKKGREEVAKLKKEKAALTKLQKEMAKSREETDKGKATDKGKMKDSGSEKDETSVEQGKAEQGKADAEVQKGEQEAQEEGITSNSETGGSSDGDIKKAEENINSKGASSQDNQLQSKAPPEVDQEPNSSSTIPHSPPTQPLQAPDPHPGLTYALALSNAEAQIQHTMYMRISRILHLFQLHQTPHLILGSFGTGVFQNRIDLIASIFADLLIKPGGRFKNVFKTVVFAILGKETVRVFSEVFSRVDKRAQREIGGMGVQCVFLDRDNMNDGDAKEGRAEMKMRMMRWESRRTALMNAAQDEADAACIAAAQFNVATYAASSADAQADATAYAAQLEASATALANPADGDSADRIPEDEKMILTKDGETVDLVPEATANTPKAVIVDDGKDVEMVPLSTQISRSNEKEDDGDVEMQ